MDALLMCGGRGTRLEADVEKPLLEVGGRPMVARVRDALAASRVDRTYAAVSPNAPETAAAVDLPTVETPGEGYVTDLQAALSDGRISEPVLTVAADLPLLTGPLLDRVLDAHRGGRPRGDGGAITVAVPAALKRALGVSCDTTFERAGFELAPTGVNVVADGEAVRLTHDARAAINVNRRADAAVAERFLEDGPPSAEEL